MDPVKAFWIEPVDGQFVISLRRFTFASSEHRPGGKACPARSWGHDASVSIGEGTIADCPRLHEGRPVHGDVFDHADARWPTKCAHCEYVFQVDDEWQFRPEQLYRRPDTGETFLLHQAPVGAIWNAHWMVERSFADYVGPDGQALVGRCPDGHDWHIDGRASNCDSPCAHCSRPYHQHSNDEQCPQGYKDARPHKCWVREGTPPELTVGKNGITCGAGAGSIQTTKWHGFLTNGHFRTC